MRQFNSTQRNENNQTHYQLTINKMSLQTRKDRIVLDLRELKENVSNMNNIDKISEAIEMLEELYLFEND